MWPSSCSLAARIARLEAESQIRRIKSRYLNACDSKDVAAIRACFIPEAVLDDAERRELSATRQYSEQPLRPLAWRVDERMDRVEIYLAGAKSEGYKR